MTYVLCRREVGPIGGPKAYCSKPIKTRNKMDWCDTHLLTVPWWPTEGAKPEPNQFEHEGDDSPYQTSYHF